MASCGLIMNRTVAVVTIMDASNSYTSGSGHMNTVALPYTLSPMYRSQRMHQTLYSTV